MAKDVDAHLLGLDAQHAAARRLGKTAKPMTGDTDAAKAKQQRPGMN